MTYRVIFLFGIGDLYQSIQLAARAQNASIVASTPLDVAVEWWFRYQLRRRLYIDLIPRALDTQPIKLESNFYNTTSDYADMLYRQVIRVIYAHRMQCFQYRCDARVSSLELSLIFQVDSSDLLSR